MNAPHMRQTDAERRDLALHLAAIVLRPLYVPFGVDNLQRAHRHMVAARWSEQAADLMEMVIRPYEKAAAEQRRIEELVNAGRSIETRFAWLVFDQRLDVDEGRCQQGVVRDEDGNVVNVYYWAREEDSPWLLLGVGAYRKALVYLAAADPSRPGQAGYRRRLAETIWSHLTDAQRAEVIAGAN